MVQLKHVLVQVKRNRNDNRFHFCLILNYSIWATFHIIQKLKTLSIKDRLLYTSHTGLLWCGLCTPSTGLCEGGSALHAHYRSRVGTVGSPSVRADSVHTDVHKHQVNTNTGLWSNCRKGSLSPTGHTHMLWKNERTQIHINTQVQTQNITNAYKYFIFILNAYKYWGAWNLMLKNNFGTTSTPTLLQKTMLSLSIIQL